MNITLYKYRADSEFTERLITSGKVFLATAHQLNDPFECSLGEISKNWVDEQVKQHMQASIAGFAAAARQSASYQQAFFGLSPSEIEAALNKVMHSGDLEDCYNAWREFMTEQTGHPPSDSRAFYWRFDEKLTQTGIFSMSSDPEQALMWAHYAAEQHGLCLGFSPTPGSKLADPTHCLRVTYSDVLPQMGREGLKVSKAFAVDAQGRPYISSMKLAFTDKTYQRVVTTKPTCWSYEQEYRYIEPFGGLCDWPGTLSECVFGSRCPEDRRQWYIDLLEGHVPNDVALFEMRPASGTNAMIRVPLDPPTARSQVTKANIRSSDTPTVELPVREFAARMEQLIQQEQYGEVIFQTDENLKTDPSAPILLHLKATAHGKAGEHEKALDIFSELADRFPGVAGSWYGMACALESLGRLDEVVSLLRKASELDPNDPSISLNLGVHLANNSETVEEGLTWLRRAEKLGHRRATRIIDQIVGGEASG